MAGHKRIRRIKPVLLSEKLGADDAADVARALGVPVEDLFFAEPSITELENIVKKQAALTDGGAQTDEEAEGNISMVLSAVLKTGERRSVFKKEALATEPASTFADLIHIASMFVAERIAEVFSLEGEDDPKAQTPSGESGNSTK